MRHTLLFVILILLLPVSVAMQDLLPAIPVAQARIQFLPVLFCFAMLALPLLPALFFALATALVQGLVLLQIQAGQSELGLTLPIVFFTAWAIVLQMSSEATHGMRWELHAFGSALVTLTLLGGEFLVLCIKRGGFPLDMSVGLRIIVPALAAPFIAPALYFMLRALVPLSPDAGPVAAQPSFKR
ncbi:MAG: hypothetical protein K8R38_08340 [Verrucomicrobia bacterium]|nr:hypothetical protein [Verrucomicrobiota bacterium]